MTVLMRVIALLIGYCLGMITFGYIFGLINHVDLRKEGSGNIGSTNTLRVLGNGYGFLTLFCDCMKVIVAGIIVFFLFREKTGDHIHLLLLYAGAGAVLGHNYPAIMKFQGGKGIACTVGILLMCFPECFIPAFIVFMGAAFITRYISVASLTGIVSVLVSAIIMGQMGWLHFNPADLPEAYIILAILTVMAYWKHRSNIVRLIHGEENRFSFHHKEKGEE
ncbi:MAG: glycerol-3-phosphate 1-O-acyltransferase PlsY [Lachnospiraceae bacterium]|nr:glycerol-3-phosphate 1-O-acyltransferase PlsY [Lachnospiraceae bacterium]